MKAEGSRKHGKRIPIEVRQEILRCCEESSRSIAQIAEDYGVSENTIYAWRKRSVESSVDVSGLSREALEQENRQLRKRLAEAEQEKEIIKKALGYFAGNHR